MNVDDTIGKAHIGFTTAAVSITVPVAVFLLVIWILQWIPHHVGRRHSMLAPSFATAVLLTTFTPQPVLATGLLMAALVVASLLGAGPRGSAPDLPDQRARLSAP